MNAALGVLILHGFTSSRSTVAPVVPQTEALGLPWRLPQLRGHWTQPQDLIGVTYEDMFADAQAALADLRTQAERVVVVGLSVGGLISLDLALRAPESLDSLVVLAPALRYVNPFARFAPLLSRVMKWASGDENAGFNDPTLKSRANNYNTFPTATFASIVQASRRVEAALPRVQTPLLILGARHDRVIPAMASQITYDRVGTQDKRLIWFERSGHEMLLDCEGDAVADRIGQFLQARAARFGHTRPEVVVRQPVPDEVQR
jgi:carboxylesterase